MLTKPEVNIHLAHEFHEEIERVLRLKQASLNSDVAAVALDNAHSVAFHSGLGSSIYPSASTPYQKYLNEEYIASYADVVYTQPNVALVADGASPESLSRWAGQFFKGLPAAAQSGQSLKTEATKYFGGEQRTSHAAGNSMVIAFPGSDIAGSKPELDVLASLLGGKSTIKWAPGYSLLSKATASLSGLSVSASNLAYSDAGLLNIQLTGNAASVRKAAEETVKALKSVADGSVSKDDVTKAIANAKFDALEKGQLRNESIHLAGVGILNGGQPLDAAAVTKSFDSVTADKLKAVSFPSLSIYKLSLTNIILQAAKTLLESKATVATVGDLFILPYAEEIGLRA